MGATGLRRNARTGSGPELADLRERILGLCEPDAEAGEASEPTPHARAAALELTAGAGHLVAGVFPRGWAGMDDDGGIRVEWVRAGRQVRLVIPASSAGTAYIYHQDEQAHDVDKRVSPESLAHWLDWLADA